MKKTILLITAIVLLFAGCKKFDTIEASKVEIKNENIEIGWDYIKINAEYEYPVELESVNLMLSLKEDMSEVNVYECKLEGKCFSVEVNDLEYGEQYHYCYEFYNGYEKERSENRKVNGHEYVDLGLPSGLKWATCNVGADKPEDYGDYFAWGEITTKDTYTEKNSLTYGVGYLSLQTQGIIDGNGNLTPSYDAATANWGGDWRMPTREECQELLDNCTWTWTTQNGVNGYNVASKTNSNSIFLPAAGCRNGSSLNSAGGNGSFWSSTPNSISYAYYLYFNSSSHDVLSNGRSNGSTVRPVTE